MDCIDIFHDVIVHCFDAPCDIYLTLQHGSLRFTCQTLDFLNKFIGFLLGDKLCRRNRIHKKFQLRQFKIAIDHLIVRSSSILCFLNFDAEIIQLRNIII